MPENTPVQRPRDGAPVHDFTGSPDAVRPTSPPDQTRPPSAATAERKQGSSTFGLLGTASTMGLHMVSGPIVGGVLGWLVDRWAGSWPWGAGIGVLLGVAAGFRNVWADARHILNEQERMDAEQTRPKN